MLFARFLLALGLLAAAVAAGAVPFTSLFAFGDSSTDTGRRLQLQLTKPGSPPYYMGRHSNGPMAVEYLAGALGLAAPGQFVDYAVGGALSGHGNVDPDPVLSATGLLDQFDTFHLDHAAADPGALYFIWGGDNDINACKDPGGNSCTPDEIQDAVTNLESLVQDLSGLGALHFMVIGSYGGGTNKNDFRSLLRATMLSLDATLAGDILYFDARPVLLDMIAPGNPYGFTHTSSASPCYTGDLSGSGGSVCVDPDTYVFWDPQGHLTAPANQILGNAMVDAVVPAPGTLALLGLALAGMGGVRRKHAMGDGGASGKPGRTHFLATEG